MSMPYLGPAGSGEPEVPVDRHADEPATEAAIEAAEPKSRPGLAVEPVEPWLPARGGWTLIALIPHDGKEPPASLTDELAQAVWCARLGPLASLAPRPGRRAPPDRADRDALAAGPRRRSASSPATWPIGSLPAIAPRPRTPARS